MTHSQTRGSDMTQSEVSVKALEWDEDAGWPRIANTPFGQYKIWAGKDVWFQTTWLRDMHAPSYDVAKEWAQADFEARIRSALATPPVEAEPAAWTDDEKLAFVALAHHILAQSNGSETGFTSDHARIVLAALNKLQATHPPATQPPDDIREAVVLPDGMELGKFKPCQIINIEAGITEYVYEDCSSVAVPVVEGIHHAVDWMLSLDGRLVGIQFWSIHPDLAAPHTQGVRDAALTSAEEEIAKLRTALGFYSQQWIGGHDRFWEPSFQLLQDCGQRARAALQASDPTNAV